MERQTIEDFHFENTGYDDDFEVAVDLPKWMQDKFLREGDLCESELWLKGYSLSPSDGGEFSGMAQLGFKYRCYITLVRHPSLLSESQHIDLAAFATVTRDQAEKTLSDLAKEYYQNPPDGIL